MIFFLNILFILNLMAQDANLTIFDVDKYQLDYFEKALGQLKKKQYSLSVQNFKKAAGVSAQIDDKNLLYLAWNYNLLDKRVSARNVIEKINSKNLSDKEKMFLHDLKKNVNEYLNTTERELFLEGLKLLKNKRYSSAVSKFNQSYLRQGKYQNKSQFYLVQLYYLQRRYKVALAESEKVKTDDLSQSQTDYLESITNKMKQDLPKPKKKDIDKKQD